MIVSYVIEMSKKKKSEISSFSARKLGTKNCAFQLVNFYVKYLFEVVSLPEELTFLARELECGLSCQLFVSSFPGNCSSAANASSTENI